MAKQKNNPLTDALAKELGYKDAEELKDSLVERLVISIVIPQ